MLMSRTRRRRPHRTIDRNRKHCQICNLLSTVSSRGSTRSVRSNLKMDLSRVHRPFRSLEESGLTAGVLFCFSRAHLAPTLYPLPTPQTQARNTYDAFDS
ncbi:hypothetical protein JAAARDRAFT_519018 [Jaapia argillacea MUCL 33604]|uniref:Uncharacterized protein n=1 Tax=Jaapia argillacea MUCL 33604 TaxID=933084 RepID=A0A067Q3Q2_9AGAM|nr:hypothetical protein JAAARDRAFT_519018 [Jaapia argillacea MUCL 33604]